MRKREREKERRVYVGEIEGNYSGNWIKNKYWKEKDYGKKRENS